MSKQFPSLVIIVFDAARAQNFGCYGYNLETTPFLSSLTEKAAVYNNAICSSYWTLPSFASLFTGTYVSRHGLIMDGHRLGSDLITMAEFLSGRGYDTAAFCHNPYVSDYTGLERGFNYFEKNIYRKYDKIIGQFNKIIKAASSGKGSASSLQRTKNKTDAEGSSNNYDRKQWLKKCFIDKGAADMNRRALDWLRNRINHDRPFFLILLYGETHAPYCPPLPYRIKFLRGHGPVTRPLRKINQERTPFNTGRITMNEMDIAGLKALYDGSIAYSDHCVKRFYKELERMGILDNTIFAVTADHGDNLGEHGLLSHVHCLYDTLVRIPLIIQWPRGTGLFGTQDYIVQNIDIFPTMAGILGDEDRLNDQIEGKSLLSGRGKDREDYAVSELLKPFGPDAMPYREELQKYDRRLIAVRSRKYKFIWSSRGDHELYNIANDPNEGNNLFGSRGEADHSDAVRSLIEYSNSWVDRSNVLYEKLKDEIETQNAPGVDEDIKSKLKQLGYF